MHFRVIQVVVEPWIRVCRCKFKFITQMPVKKRTYDVKYFTAQRKILQYMDMNYDGKLAYMHIIHMYMFCVPCGECSCCDNRWHCIGTHLGKMRREIHVQRRYTVRNDPVGALYHNGCSAKLPSEEQNCAISRALAVQSSGSTAYREPRQIPRVVLKSSGFGACSKCKNTLVQEWILTGNTISSC